MLVSSRALKGLICSLIVAAALVVPGLLRADVERATLYPRGATIQERVDIEEKSARVELSLPGKARKDTLRVRAAEGEVRSVSLRREERRADPEEIRKLKQRIEELEGEKAQTRNDLRRVGKLISFYEGKVSAETKGAKETAEMAKLLDDSLEDLYSKRRTYRDKRSDLDEKLRKARERLKELTGGENTVWRVQVRMEEPLPSGSRVEYSYFLPSASWTPEYTLNALPERQEVELVWRARILQRSGLDWQGASLRVATAVKRFRPDPPPIREWVIRPAPSGKRALDTTALSAEAVSKRAGAAQAPERQRTYSADVYELGRVDLPAGEKRRLTLRRMSLPARFIHLLRPLEMPESFLRAKLRSEERMRLPQGKAALELEGAYVGRTSFSMRGKATRVSFGVDRDVVPEVEGLVKKGGKQGFFRDRKTYEWGWRFRIANHRDEGVRVRMELPWPRLRSDEIELEPLYDFSEKDVQEHRAIKELDLSASGNATVEYGIRISYPKEMDLDLGRFE